MTAVIIADRVQLNIGGRSDSGVVAEDAAILPLRIRRPIAHHDVVEKENRDVGRPHPLRCEIRKEGILHEAVESIYVHDTKRLASTLDGERSTIGDRNACRGARYGGGEVEQG